MLLANAAAAERQLRSLNLGELPLMRPAGESAGLSQDPAGMWAGGSSSMASAAPPVCGALLRPSFLEDRGQPLPLWPAGSTGFAPPLGFAPALLPENMLRPSSAEAGPHAQLLPLWPAGSTSAFPPVSVSLLRASFDRPVSQELPMWAGNAAIVSPPSLPGH